MVEFALIVALLLAILFGILEFGRAWFYSNHLTNAVRSAARYGAVLEDEITRNDWNRGEFENAIDTYLRDEIESADANGRAMNPDKITNINITLTGSDGTVNTGLPETGDKLTVSVGYDFDFVAEGILNYFSSGDDVVGDTSLTKSASMQYEG